jgi:AraC-like DNA-binding protein
VGTGSKPPEVFRIVDRDTPDLDCTSERTIVDLQGDGPLVSLGRYRYLTARDPMPPQRHTSLLVLAFPIRSDVQFYLDGRVVNVVPGQVIVIPPRTAYFIGGHAQTRGELFWLVARVRSGDQAAGSLDRAIRQLTNGERQTWAVPGSFAADLGRALAEPDDQRWAVIAARRALCATAVFGVLARAENVAEPVHTMPPAVRRALAYVDEQMDRPITVQDLIEASGVSPTNFYDAFALSMGTSPKDYILRTKIARARVLLADPTQNIIDVCYQLGFSSSQHFAEVFRRYEGMSPSQYRREGNPRPHTYH